MPEYVLTVSALNRYVKAIIEEDINLKTVYVKGEISNFTNHYKTGHFYFTLKDEGAQIKAVMFKGANSRLRFMPENSMSVIARGYVGVYEKTGEYQLYIDDMQPDGTGALALAFEQLKKKLFAAGLFAQEHKKKIPEFPERVGVVTSETGAAVRDIINVISRRYPLAEIVLCPVQVQGESAAGQIAQAIRMFNDRGCADVLIVGRGGGSMEDLWAFNEEIVAYAVYESEIPVISAVGHETDFTICDFVADLRAPTPSAAAELAVPDVQELRENLYLYGRSMNNSVSSFLLREQGRVERFFSVLKNQSPKNKIDNLTLRLDSAITALDYSAEAYISKKEKTLSEFATKLDAISPLKILSRGYSLVTKDDAVISSADNLSKGDVVDITLGKGKVRGQIL